MLRQQPFTEHAGNGVVVVKTKQGKAGKLRINYKSSITLSESARMPEYCDAYTYALLANEAKLSREMIRFTVLFS